MRVRRVEVRNFRGVASLDWRIPAETKFVCLIGPGDSCKSTILDAIYYTLGDRWNLAFTDNDFFNADASNTVSVRVAVAALPPEIRSHRQLGMDLSGIDAAGEWVHDPHDGYEPCIIIQFTVDSDMEPLWTLHRPGGEEANAIGAGIRRRLSVFRIDDRVDNHLKWSRTSALSRLTDATHGTSGTLAAANRAARGAVATAVTDELMTLTSKVRGRLGSLGSGDFADLRPGLDTGSDSSLALYNGDVPLTSYGLGTRRLAGIATQQMVAEHKAIILVDEIEHGLEPHRLVHLLNELRAEERSAQVFTTTHSSVAVEQLRSADLGVVRVNDGVATVTFIPDDLDSAQGTLRLRPSAFLARRIVVTEGKTEYGLLLGMVEKWDATRSADGMAGSAACGVTVTDGGGSTAPNRAKVLRTLGYETALFLDHDVQHQEGAINAARAMGVEVCQWSKGRATEDELVAELDVDVLSELLQVAVEQRVNEATVRSDLLNTQSKTSGTQPEAPKVPDLVVQNWIENADFSIESARALVARTAREAKWFKSVDGGRALSEFVESHRGQLEGGAFGATLGKVRTFIYPPGPALAERTESQGSEPVEPGS